ncbi:MAG: hypothetical protein K6F34_06725 [Lachnospiraceae bacterium]|nr:hypothetical protein [Lachnospiraceae bacterium]
MKNNKDKQNGKKAVTCTPVDWEDYRIRKDAKSGSKKDRREQGTPEVGKKWAIENDEDLRKSRAKDNANGTKDAAPGPVSAGNGAGPADVAMSDSPDKKPSRKKSLNAKLNELGNSNWVSTGNFRHEDGTSVREADRLEDKIINEAAGTQDEFLKNAMKVVSDALKEGGTETAEAPGVPGNDTFEIPKLDIHFGDTAELKDISSEIETIRKANIDKIVKERDLEAAIEKQTSKEITEEDELKKLKKELSQAKKKSSSGKKSSKNAEGKTSGKKKTKEAEEKIFIRSEEVGKEKKSSSASGASAAKNGKAAKAQAGSSKGKSAKSSGKKAAVSAAASGKSKRNAKNAGAGHTGPRTGAKRSGAKGPGRDAGPSDFRKRSADWKDEKTLKKGERISLIKEKKAAFKTRIKNITPLQWSIAGMALVIFITAIMTSAVYANYQGEQNKASALASLGRYNEDDSYASAVESVTSEMLPEAASEPEEVVAKALSLEMSSVEKDLKIRLIDEEDTLVKDIDWSVTVSKEDSEEGDVYDDDDKDGTIYITDIAAGDYSVTLNPSDSLADYILPQEKQLVSVKAAIEYKVIANIKDEIKSEKEVNVALEDPNGNQAADVETGTALTDTVEWCESTKTASGEEYVEATPDISKTAASVRDKHSLLTALKKMSGTPGMPVPGVSALGFTFTPGFTVAESEVEVEIPVEEPVETESSLSIRGAGTIKVGESITLTADLKPSDAKVEDWWTNADGIVEISKNGNDCTVKGIAEGSVEISAKGTNNVTSSVTVKVGGSSASQEAGLSISGPGSVAVGSSIKITAKCTPSDATVTWSISDIGLVSLKDNNDNTCTLTGNGNGKVTLTASCSNGKTTTMDITVGSSSSSGDTGNYSDSAQIYDSNKNPLYVKDDASGYRLANYGDYKSGNYSKFYRKQEGYLYTGWQNIDGRTYYYKSDHTYVTGEQVIQGIKYSFGSDGILSTGTGTLGIDVSKYQPNINWSAVKASGVNYAIIRCGYRGASTGALIQDPYFVSHIKGAKAAGLKVGVYFFTTALNETEAVEEASMCAALCSGYGINYPIFIDCEPSSRPGYNSLSASERTAIIRAFCSTIKSAGYTPGVYANKTWLTEKINASALSGCKIWLAQYNAAGPTYSGRYDIWQYTSKGHVDGIPGNVDMNQSFLGY